MKLDRCAESEFENIQPPMVNAITIPVEGTNVVIYVCGTPFRPASKDEVSKVVKSLRLDEVCTEAWKCEADRDWLASQPQTDTTNRLINLLNDKLFNLGVRDSCELCHGEKRGVPGNENIVDINGKLTFVCDYCSVTP